MECYPLDNSRYYKLSLLLFHFLHANKTLKMIRHLISNCYASWRIYKIYIYLDSCYKNINIRDEFHFSGVH